MTTQKYGRMLQWTPPPRPEWVQRVNEEGNFLDLSAVIPLDEGSLIDRAIANTGLSDFGDEDWREPFKVLVKGLDQEAHLNLMGRILTRTDLLMFLEARLRVEDTYGTDIPKSRRSKSIVRFGSSGREGVAPLCFIRCWLNPLATGLPPMGMLYSQCRCPE